jgi:hypothetical protein
MKDQFGSFVEGLIFYTGLITLGIIFLVIVFNLHDIV